MRAFALPPSEAAVVVVVVVAGKHRLCFVFISPGDITRSRVSILPTLLFTLNPGLCTFGIFFFRVWLSVMHRGTYTHDLKYSKHTRTIGFTADALITNENRTKGNIPLKVDQL